VVKISHVHKYFGRLHVLDDLSLEVARGEVVVIIGPSGSGKSTLLRCLNHLEAVQSGEIWIDGVRLDHHRTNIRHVRTEIGFVFQSYNLVPTLTALENVALAGEYAGTGRRGFCGEQHYVAVGFSLVWC
jgi:ABC-type polar amino acid transport system ATPase subunit